MTDKTESPMERSETQSGGADQMRTTEEIIGRADVNDLEAILSFIGHQEESGHHNVADQCEAEFTWDYEKGRLAKLDRLYEKAKTAQWNGQTDLPWETQVDQEAVVMANFATHPDQMGWTDAMLEGTSLEKWSDKEWLRFGVESQNWTLSQFMHGEQGALLCTAKIVETVPWIDAKYYAATQVVDEARHVEVFSRYLYEKLSGHYPLNGHLGLLLDDIIADSRWDMTYLGMQIMVEGLALAAFGFMHQLTQEPLLKQLLRYVMADEARHVAFGVLSLQELYSELSEPELRERQEFAFEAAVRMRDRLRSQEVWDRMEVPWNDVVTLMGRQDPNQDDFQIMLFSRIVPNLRKLGLLDAADGWLRQRFTEMGVIAFEHLSDSTEDEDAFADGSPVTRQVA
ncbi:MAG TPA: ferritin-like domain-containing protein [Acidimicrobiales bacterium]|nr:ferritin-like domain-containing protein [Acidimicrobiales bacterium]